MSDAPRRLAITSRFSLADVSEGWSDCYVIYSHVSSADLKQLAEIKTDVDESQGLQLIIDFAKQHIIEGKICVIGTDGKPKVTDMVIEDVDQFPPNVITDLFMDMTGAKYLDPKASQMAVDPEPRQDVSDPGTATS